VKYFGWTTLFEGPPFGIGMLAAGIILAIMIVPIISAITREVMTAVRNSSAKRYWHWRDALGDDPHRCPAQRACWNMGGIILGLGRALGETMAVTW
jgi:phosphate transport system permease protein